ncbi:NUDIX hydrolase [Marinicellulosiphila megalodicopiae]|uniref:NUDIX hydrolase n=1 Tax=Marinicellulosiphila megalodicopiae TaxID=2724896 RepID=UPI003BB17438
MSKSMNASIATELSMIINKNEKSKASASVLIIVREFEQKLQVLLTLRSETLRNHSGEWALPGGKCDKGETSGQTAMRESNEEIGLNIDQIKIVGQLESFQSKDGLEVDVWIGVLKDKDFRPILNEAEVQKILWLDLHHLLKKADRTHKLKRSHTYVSIPFYDFLTPSLWGLTAMILHGLGKKINRNMNDLPVLQMLLREK